METCKTIDTVLKKWETFGDSKRFFRLKKYDEITPKFCITSDHIGKFLHHAASIFV